MSISSGQSFALLFAASYDAPVSICQYTISFHMERRRYEYMVDTAFSKAVGIEAIEGSVHCIAEVTLFV